jgi:hypothetical protein
MRGEDDRTGGLSSYSRRDHPLRTFRAIVNEVVSALERGLGALYAPIGRPTIAPENGTIRFFREPGPGWKPDIATKFLSAVPARPLQRAFCCGWRATHLDKVDMARRKHFAVTKKNPKRIRLGAQRLVASA